MVSIIAWFEKSNTDVSVLIGHITSSLSASANAQYNFYIISRRVEVREIIIVCKALWEL